MHFTISHSEKMPKIFLKNDAKQALNPSKISFKIIYINTTFTSDLVIDVFSNLFQGWPMIDLNGEAEFMWLTPT